MEAVILAGGLGTRLRSLVPDLPKPMAPVAGRPFLEILLRTLATKGITRVVFSVGFMADKIIRHFGQQFEQISIVYEAENEPLGTGGALRQALSRCESDHAFVLNGDTYLDLEIERVEAHWLEHRRPIIVGRAVPDTSRYGKLRIADGKVCGFDEKGASGPGVINAGCYVFPRGQLDAWPAGSRFSLEQDYLAKVIPRYPFELFLTTAQFIDIGLPEDYARAEVELAHLL